MGTNQINNWGLLTGLASDVNSGTLVTCPYLRRCFPTGTEHHRLKRYDSTKFAKLMTREIRGLSFTFTNFSAGNISKPTFRSVSRWIQDLEETGIPPRSSTKASARSCAIRVQKIVAQYLGGEIFRDL